jgi:hypothetical protein
MDLPDPVMMSKQSARNEKQRHTLGELRRFQSALQVGGSIHQYLSRLRVELRRRQLLQMIHLMIHLVCESDPTD